MKNDNTKQSKFDYIKLGSNLDSNHIIFTVEWLVNDFFNHFEYLFHEPKTTGRPKKYKPRELLGFLFISNIRGVKSCRGMADLLNNNDESLNYILNNKRPGKSIISKFKNDYDLMISEFFYYIVQIGIELNLVGGEIVGIDGTFIKANTSINNRASRKELKFLKKILKNITPENKKELEEYFKVEGENKNKSEYLKKIIKKLNKPALKLLKSAIESKKKITNALNFLNKIEKIHDPETDYKISLNDCEARYMADKKGVSGYNYNLQIATDDKYDFIIYMDLNIEPNDKNQLINMIESSIMSLGSKPKHFTADNGYYNDQAIHYCITHEISLIMPDQTEAQITNDKISSKVFPKKDFHHDRINDFFMCPLGNILMKQSQRRMNDKMWNVYSEYDCFYCELRPFCTTKEKREILEIADPAKQYLKDSYYSDKGQMIYKRRGPITESRFGLLKAGRNFLGLKRSGRKKSRTDLLLEGISNNIQIIHKYGDLSKLKR